MCGPTVKTLKYNQLGKPIPQKCREDKGSQINKQCDEIEDLKKKDMKIMHSKIKRMTKNGCVTADSDIRYRNGEILFETNNRKVLRY